MNGSRRLVITAITAALVAFGVFGVARFTGPEHVPGGGPANGADHRPIAFDDYALQFYYGWLGSGFLAEHGTTHGYDPHFMAGYVKMPLYYPSSKPYEYALLVQTRWLGVDPARAFDNTVFAMLALLPVLAWGAARLFGMPPVEQMLVVAFSVVPNALVPLAGTYSILEAAGMVPYVFAAFLSVWVVALMSRFLETQRVVYGVVLAVAAPLLFLCHLTAGFLVFVPFGVLYAAAFRRAARTTHAALWGILFLTVAFNWIWLEGYFMYGHYAELGDFYTEGGKDHFAPPGGWLAPFQVDVPRPRWLALCPPLFGIAGLVLWRREGRTARWWIFAPQIAFLFLVTYYGVHVGLSSIGPSRIALPLGLYLFFPAAHALCVGIAALHGRLSAMTPARWNFAPSAVATAALGLVFAGLVVSGDVGDRLFRPYSIPELESRAGYDAVGRGLLDWLRARTDASGRLLHEETDRLSHRYYGTHMPALIPLEAGVPLANGPAPHALLKNNYLRFIAGTFRGRRLGQVAFDEMSNHLALYNVRWVLTWSPAAGQYFGRHPAMRPVGSYDKFTLFEVRGSPSYVMHGRANVEASPNRIALSKVATDDGVVMLKFHWLESLRTDPPREITPVMQLDDPVPFIQITDPPAEIVVYNAY
ncbi:MAG: hypothetical protein HRU01_30395 [Myxococcales bacterium]|nr:hypothetical protein [Myxococcales bacterium]